MGVSYTTTLIYGFNVDDERFEKWWREQGFDIEEDGGLWEIVHEQSHDELLGLTAEYGGSAYYEADENSWWLGHKIATAYGVGGNPVNLNGVDVDETRLLELWRLFGTADSKIGHFLVLSIG